MPSFTEDEMETILAKARLLGATKYSKGGNGSIYMLDDENNMKAFARPGYKLWVAKEPFHKIHDTAEGTSSLANLRKRYEH